MRLEAVGRLGVGIAVVLILASDLDNVLFAAQDKRLKQHEHQGEFYAWLGNLPLAITQFELAAKSGDGDFYQASVVEARLRTMRRELAERGLRDNSDADPVEEIPVCWGILKSLGLREKGFEIKLKEPYGLVLDALAKAGWMIPSPPATMFAWAPIPDMFAHLGSLEFSKLLLERAGVAVSPGVGFGEYGEGYVRIALVENEQRIRQAARNIRRFLETGPEMLHNVVPLATRR